MPLHQSGVHPQTTAKYPSAVLMASFKAHHIAKHWWCILCAAAFVRAAPLGLLHLTQHLPSRAAASIYAASAPSVHHSAPSLTVKRAIVPLMVASTTSALFTLNR